MNAPAFENLDILCAQQAECLVSSKAKGLEKLITAALGVLEEQGVYALFLYLGSSKDENALGVRSKLLDFLHDKFPDEDAPQDYAFLRKMAEDLDGLLLAQALLQQILTYARYHAKANEETSGAQS